MNLPAPFGCLYGCLLLLAAVGCSPRSGRTGSETMDPVLVPVEDLRIGQAEGPDEYMFGLIGAIAEAADGTVFIADWRVPDSPMVWLSSPEGGATNFVRQTLSIVTTQGLLAVGHNDEYAIEIRDGDQVTKVIERDWEPVMISSSERNEWTALQKATNDRLERATIVS